MRDIYVIKFIKKLGLVLFIIGAKYTFASTTMDENIHNNFNASLNTYLSKPTGTYAVGFQDIRMVNGTFINGSYRCTSDYSGQQDILYIKGQNEIDFGKDNQIDHCREVMVRIYYPSNLHSHRYNNYYNPAINDWISLIRGAHISEITEDDILNLKQTQSFSINNLPIADKHFPVLIFVPGSTVEAQQYENIINEVVSNGYIVLAINNTFVGSSILFPDGRIVHNQDASKNISNFDKSVLNDILFIRNALTDVSTQENLLSNVLDNHIIINKIGIFGHSMGAIAMIKAIKEYPDMFHAAISFDAPPTAFGTRVFSPSELIGFENFPFLRLFGAEWRNLGGVVTPKDAQFKLFKDNYYALLSPDENNITYTQHMSFTDSSTLQYQPAIKILVDNIAPDGFGTADGWKITQYINDYVLQFFDKYLKSIPSQSLDKCLSISNDTTLQCQNTN